MTKYTILGCDLKLINNPSYDLLLIEEIIMAAWPTSATIVGHTTEPGQPPEVGFVIMGKDMLYVNIKDNRLRIYPHEINLVDQNADPVKWLKEKVNEIIFNRYRGKMKLADYTSHKGSIQRLLGELK